MESKGIFMMVWGKPQYGWMAFQLAMSVKYHSPSIPIHLLTDDLAISRMRDEQLRLFDSIEQFETPLDPAMAKIMMYDRLPFDHTIFLDADGIALQPMDKLFDQFMADDRPFRCAVHAYYNKHDPPDMPLMVWAKRDVIWNHYGFTDETLPATQSSLLYIRKSDQSKEIYQKMMANYVNKIPLEQLKNRWGGGQPDELYLNVTLAQMGYDPACPNVVYFADDRTYRPHQLKDKYHLLSLFGTANNVKPPFEGFYDKEVENLSKHFGGLQTYKWKSIKQFKHANIQQLKTKRAAFQGKFIRHERLTEVVKPNGRTFLFTSYWDTGNPIRQKELNDCLMNNVACSQIDHIYVYSESQTHPIHPKITWQYNGRPTYRDLINWANDLCTGDDVSIIANSDIYFNDTLNFVHQVNMTRTMIALSRWDMVKGRPRLFDYEHSQDTWIFKGKINIAGGEYYMGLPGCDNRIAFDANASGYRVVNTAKDIHTFHLHESNYRSYVENRDRLIGDYMPVFITSIRDLKGSRVLIKQPGKVGDILIVAPIAKHYADQGYEVHWQAPQQYHAMIRKLGYATPVIAKEGNYANEIDLSFGIIQNTPTHLWWLKNKSQFPTFVHAKYQLAGVDINERYNLQYLRNETDETALFEALGLTDESVYCLYHPASDYGRVAPVSDFPYGRVIKFEPVGNFDIFAWRKVIQKAKEIHCIDSSLANFVEVLNPPCKKVFYRVPERVTESWFDFTKWELYDMNLIPA